MRRPCVSALALAFILFAFLHPAEAAVFDALGMVDRLDENGAYASLHVSGSLKTGNSEESRVAGSIGTGYQRNAHTIFLTGAGEYGEAFGETYAGNAFEHLRYRYMFNATWGTEAFLQAEHDAFRRIRVRGLAGAGARLVFPSFSVFTAALGAGLMGERLIVTQTVNEVEITVADSALRATTYLTLDAVFAASGSFRLAAYYQPRLDAFGDNRVSARAAVRMQFTTWLYGELYSGVQYDNTPLAQVEKFDTNSGFALGFEWKP